MVEKQEIAVESAHWEGAALRHLLVHGQPQPALQVPNTGIYKLRAGMGTNPQVRCPLDLQVEADQGNDTLEVRDVGAEKRGHHPKNVCVSPPILTSFHFVYKRQNCSTSSLPNQFW